MTWWATVLGLIFGAGPFLLTAFLMDRENRLRHRKRKVRAEPAPPTPGEIRAQAMGHWDERFYAALEAALPPGVCNCGTRRITNACPIHARSPEHTYPLQGIHRHIKHNNRLQGLDLGCTCDTETITEQILCQAQPYVHTIITQYDPACPQHWPHTK